MGLFSSNKKTSKQEKIQNPEYLKLVVRWEAFLGKMETRFTESLVNAEEAILDNLNESDYDLTPTMTAWSGIKSQLQNLDNKIEDTFNNKVKPKMLDYIEEWDVIDEKQKGVRLGDSFRKRIERFEIVLEGKVSKLFFNHAIKELNKDFKCTQCSAKIEVKKDVFRSHYVSCDYCNTVNTFTPNDKITAIRWVVDNIAKYDSIAEWDTMKEYYDKYKELRSPSHGDENKEHIEAFKKREDAERAFWLKYFTLRSEFLSDYKDTIEHDIDVKMKWLYQERKRDLNF